VQSRTVTLSSTVNNIGARDSEAVSVEYRASTDQTIDGNDTLLGTYDGPLLVPEAATNAAVATTIPGGMPIGAYYLAATSTTAADGYAGNNQKISTVLFVVGADLAVDNIPLPGPNLLPNQAINLTSNVVNIGAVASLPGNVEYRLSSDAVIDGADPLLGTFNLNALATNEASNAPVAANVPNGQPVGGYFIGATATSANDGYPPNNVARSAARFTIGLQIRVPDAATVSWDPLPGVGQYDVAYARVNTTTAPFNGDFSIFRTPSTIPPCPASCQIPGTSYTITCVGTPPTRFLDMWLVRPRTGSVATWNEGSEQVGSRDAGIPVFLCP
jgi:hypothetical protein